MERIAVHSGQTCGRQRTGDFLGVSASLAPSDASILTDIAQAKFSERGNGKS